MATTKASRRDKIKQKIRKRISGTSARPRMSVYRSNTGIYVQIIDDITGKTIVSVGSNDPAAKSMKVSKTELSKWVGKNIAEKSKAEGINAVVFDRNGYLYHGRVKALADAAREAGLEF
jgi:large subunit ribosomal protein L18